MQKRFEYPHLCHKPPTYQVTVDVQLARAKLSCCLPEIFDRAGFLWQQDAFDYTCDPVGVLVHSTGFCVYDIDLPRSLDIDANYKYEGKRFKSSSVIVSVALALQHPYVFGSQMAYSAIPFINNVSPRNRCFIGFQLKNNIIELSALLLDLNRNEAQFDFGAGNGFIVNELPI